MAKITDFKIGDKVTNEDRLQPLILAEIGFMRLYDREIIKLNLQEVLRDDWEKVKIKVKKECWINVYTNEFIPSYSFKTKEDALNNIQRKDLYLETIKYEWEEEE